MRPLHLSFEGLHSYREPVEIDFQHLGAFGLFGIFGPVGAGKSSILDALTLALYGIVDRVHGRSRRGIVNHHAEELEVRLRFAVGPACWEVHRTYRRDEAGIAQRVASRLCRQAPQGLEVVAEKEREVNARIADVVGLTPEDFMRAVVLPQGRFMQFLHLKGSERRDMLQRLFRLDAWGEGLRAELRRRQEQAALARSTRRGELDGLGDASRERIAGIEQELQAGTATLEALSAEAQQAEEAFRRADRLRQVASRAEALESERLELERQREAMATRARKLEAAQRAAQVQEPARRLQEATERDALGRAAAQARAEELRSAKQQRAEAEARHQGAVTALEEEGPVLRARAACLERMVDLTRQAESLGEELHQARLAQDQAQQERATAQEAHTAATAQVRQAEIRARSLRQELESQRVPASERAVLLDLSRSRDEIERLQAEIRRCGQLRGQEEGRLQQALVGLQVAETQRAAAGRQTAALSEQVGLLEGQLQALGPPEAVDEEQDQASRALASALEATERLKLAESELANRQERAQRAERLLGEADALVTQTSTLAEVLGQDLTRRRRRELARELAAELVPGEPCPVCGHAADSPGHPADPAHAQEPLPLAEVEDRLEAWRQAALEGRATAAERASFAAEALRGAQERARAAQAALARWGSVAEARQRAEQAKERQRALRKQLTQLETARQELAAARLEEERAEVPLATARAEVQGARRGLDARADQLRELRQAEGAAWEAFERLRGSHDFLSPHTFLTVPGAVRALQARDRRAEALTASLDAVEAELPELRAALEQAALTLRAAIRADERAAEQVSSLELRNHAMQQELASLEVLGGSPLGHGETGAPRVPGRLLRQVRQALERLEQAQREAAQLRESAITAEAHASARAAAAEATARATSDQLEAAQADLAAALARVGLPPDTRVEALLADALNPQEAALLRSQVQTWEERLLVAEHAARVAREELEQARRDFPSQADLDWDALHARREQARQNLEQTREAVIGLRQQLQDLRRRADRHARLRAELATLDHEWMRLETLGRVLRGNRFVEYVAQDYLLDLVRIANEHLARLTHHRYSLELDADGAFQIRDADGGGASRPVTSLSGGETFVASLALALALSTQVQARSANPLEFFFLDEGFGSLDPESLDRVMTAIEALRDDARMVGLISHVPGVRERVPRYLSVLPPGVNGVGSQIAVQDN